MHTHTMHTTVYLTSGDIILTYIHSVEIYPDLNHNHYLPNSNPYSSLNPNLKPYPNFKTDLHSQMKSFTLRGLAFCRQKEVEPHNATV